MKHEKDKVQVGLRVHGDAYEAFREHVEGFHVPAGVATSGLMAWFLSRPDAQRRQILEASLIADSRSATEPYLEAAQALMRGLPQVTPTPK